MKNIFTLTLLIISSISASCLRDSVKMLNDDTFVTQIIEKYQVYNDNNIEELTPYFSILNKLYKNKQSSQQLSKKEKEFIKDVLEMDITKSKIYQIEDFLIASYFTYIYKYSYIQSVIYSKTNFTKKFEDNLLINLINLKKTIKEYASIVDKDSNFNNLLNNNIINTNNREGVVKSLFLNNNELQLFFNIAVTELKMRKLNKKLTYEEYSVIYKKLFIKKLDFEIYTKWKKASSMKDEYSLGKALPPSLRDAVSSIDLSKSTEGYLYKKNKREDSVFRIFSFLSKNQKKYIEYRFGISKEGKVIDNSHTEEDTEKYLQKYYGVSVTKTKTMLREIIRRLWTDIEINKEYYKTNHKKLYFKYINRTGEEDLETFLF